MPHDRLDRFIEAQSSVIEEVMAELSAGKKETHWMWFIFPQLKVLGRSGTAKFYGLVNLDEARLYLEHPVLGPRLRHCTQAVLAHADKTADEIFGFPDYLKFRSSMTLFMMAKPDQILFNQALTQFYAGKSDPRTIEVLQETGGR